MQKASLGVTAFGLALISLLVASVLLTVGLTPVSAATEVCNGVDDDGDSLIDEGFTYQGSPINDPCFGIGACSADLGMVYCFDLNVADCSTNPGGILYNGSSETCNGIDDDCDGSKDEDFTYQGSPINDPCFGIGECGLGAVECADSNSADCSTNPGGSDYNGPNGGSAETCNGLDDDCDGSVDEDCKANGQSCTSDSECLSGFCVDDVCCDTACTGGCEVCSLAAGGSSDGTCTILNHPPTANADGPYVIETGMDLQLDGTMSSDPNAGCGDSIVSYEWDIGSDGSYEYTGHMPLVPWGDLSGLSIGVAIPITLRVTDTFGASGTDSATLTIYENVPVASFTANPNPAACNQIVTFDASSSYHKHPSRAIVGYNWDFYNDGSIDDTGITVTHSYSAFGSYTARLSVYDDNIPARSDDETLTVDITLGNNAPVADANGPYVIEIGQGLQLDGTTSSDPNAGCGDSIVSYEWDIGSDGSYEYTGHSPTVPWGDLSGLSIGVAIPITLRVTDSFGASGTDSATLTILECSAGSTRSCPNQVGVCAGSIETCAQDNTWPGCDYSSINDYENPEASCDGLDNDCDGSTDEDFTDLGASCTVGLGVCQSTGVMVCTSDGSGTECNAVPGPTLGADDDCDGVDQDCDGAADNNYLPDTSCFLPGTCSALNVGSSCSAGVETSCQTGTPAPETCDGLDNDCDGTSDEGLTDSDPANCGACGIVCSTNNMATVTCSSGVCDGTCLAGYTDCNQDKLSDGCEFMISADDDCDGIDDDCDGQIDEDYVGSTTSCGTGVCAAQGQMQCQNGVEVDTCQAGNPTGQDDDCDGIDQNCDGTADDGYVPVSTSCGVGACSASGLTSCSNGVISDSCAPGTPAADDSVCNNIDDDCNGQIDEDYVSDESCFLPGACSTLNVGSSCIVGAETLCQTGTPAADDASCDGLDNDCDGSTDEEYVPVSTSCGTGVCSAEGSTSCVDGNILDDCTEGNPIGLDDDCDGIDQNCNGNADENYLSDETCFLPGACSAFNVGSSCSAGVETACQTGTPAADDASCNNIDDDCDGAVDEEYVSDISCFLPGTCSAFNIGSTCLFGVETVCQTGTPQTETCDGLDDDCDGSTDEDYPDLGDSCTVGVGECSASGVKVCSADGTDTECDAIPGTPIAEVCGDGLDNDCDGAVDEDCGLGDADGDGVLDYMDKCDGTVDWYATQELKPNHYDSSNIVLTDTWGCSCEQILSCKPGQNSGEFKFGCSQGTYDIWVSQDPDSWAPDCQYNGVVAFEGIPKALFENTDDDWMPDLFDEDVDGDGVPDNEDDMIEDTDSPGDPDYGIPDWHPKSKHYNK
jgi:hypothetical protein